jgi:hypothetical protein
MTSRLSGEKASRNFFVMLSLAVMISGLTHPTGDGQSRSSTKRQPKGNRNVKT